MTFKVSESIWELKMQNIWANISIMAVYMIFKYSKRFRFAPSFNKRELHKQVNMQQELSQTFDTKMCIYTADVDIYYSGCKCIATKTNIYELLKITWRDGK